MMCCHTYAGAAWGNQPSWNYGGVETHVRREVIGFSERSSREKKKVKGMNNGHVREKNE